MAPSVGRHLEGRRLHPLRPAAGRGASDQTAERDGARRLDGADHRQVRELAELQQELHAATDDGAVPGADAPPARPNTPPPGEPLQVRRGRGEGERGERGERGGERASFMCCLQGLMHHHPASRFR